MWNHCIRRAKNPHPITDQCQYKLHIQLQSSVNTKCMSHYTPGPLLPACPITDQSQKQLHVQLQTRSTPCCMSKYRPVLLLTRPLSPLTEFYKIFEKVTYNRVSNFFNLNNAAGEQVSFWKSVCVGGDGETEKDPFQLYGQNHLLLLILNASDPF